jgi:hypothetical protein
MDNIEFEYIVSKLYYNFIKKTQIQSGGGESTIMKRSIVMLHN